MHRDIEINRLIIACATLKPEIEERKHEVTDAKIFYINQNLHRTPDKMTKVLQAVIDKNDQKYEKIVLGYGLCSNGVVGLNARSQPLIIPRVHDCVTLFMGSREKYHEEFSRQPGTYYLTKSWINNEKDPLGLMENEYTQRVGREDAEWAIREELKNYTRIAYIDTQTENPEKYRERARKNAGFFNKEYIEIPSRPSYIEKILKGPYNKEDFIIVEPNQIIKQKEFLK